MVFQPPVLQCINSDRLKTEGGPCTDFDLSIDLGRHLLCDRPFRADTASNSAPVLMVGQIPDLYPHIGAHFADTE